MCKNTSGLNLFGTLGANYFKVRGLSWTLNMFDRDTAHRNSQGIARTQSPTNKNDAVELPTFGAITGVNLTEVQWKGLALGEPPSWSWFTPQPGKYAPGTDWLLLGPNCHNLSFVLASVSWLVKLASATTTELGHTHQCYLTGWSEIVAAGKWPNSGQAYFVQSRDNGQRSQNVSGTFTAGWPSRSQTTVPMLRHPDKWMFGFAYHIRLSRMACECVTFDGGLIQRYFAGAVNHIPCQMLSQAALRSGDTVTSDRIERCCYC